MGKHIIEASKKVKQLHRYGITAEDVKDAEAYFEEFEQIKNAPTARRQQVAEQNSVVEAGLKECILLLENTIDPLMRIATKDNAALIRRYRAFRIVLPKGRGIMSVKEARYRKSRKKKKKE